MSSIILLMFQFSAFGFVYEGTLNDSNGTPIADPNVLILTEVMDQSSSCVLYAREFTLDLSGSSGHFSINLENGSAVTGPHSGNTLSAILSNENGNLVTCSDGGNYTFTGTFEARKLRLTIKEIGGVDITDVTLPVQTLDNIPYSQFAGSAKDLSTDLSGDVSGSYSSNTVSAIQGTSVSTTLPTSGQVLAFDGASYVPTDVSATSVDWTAITNVPTAFSDDSDEDTLGGLSCLNGQIAKFNSAAWIC